MPRHEWRDVKTLETYRADDDLHKVREDREGHRWTEPPTEEDFPAIAAEIFRLAELSEDYLDRWREEERCQEERWRGIVERLRAELEGWKTYVRSVVDLAVKGDLLRRPNPEPIHLDREASRAFLRERAQRKIVEYESLRGYIVAIPLEGEPAKLVPIGDAESTRSVDALGERAAVLRYVGRFLLPLHGAELSLLWKLRDAIAQGEHLDAQETAPEKEGK